MGLYYRDGSDLQMISGRGKAEYGASTIRKGTYSFTNASERGWRYATVTFDTPMVDADYEIILTPSVGTTAAQAMATAYTIDNKTTNGFRISYYDTTATSNVGGNYTAFKLYTDNEYNGLLNNQRYSTDEIDTGKTWIDGKKIYRKVYNLGGYSAASMTQIDATDLNVDSVIEMRALLEVNGQRSIISSNAYSNYANLGYNISTKKWYVNTGTTTTWNALIVEYTKTT